jgi:ATP-dependent RNA helicase DeaD
MEKFKELGLSQELCENIGKLGFVEPTPVQEKTIPYILENDNDLVALAQTGTGKTAAFGLPLLQKIDETNLKTQALILCPTRELCMQIAKDFYNYVGNSVKVLAVYGGSPIQKQISALNKGIQVIVATPGRLLDLINRKKVNLSNIQTVVLDEADEMLNMGFLQELDDILAKVPNESQKLLFSATMPKQVSEISKRYMQSPYEITLGKKNSGSENVVHEQYMVHARDKYLALKRIIDCQPLIYGIIFCRTRVETQDLAMKLGKEGYNAEAIHGDLSQAQRDKVMEKFRNRTLQLLVATDVAARGIDVSDITHVINYGLPDDIETYTHRSGRTGRAGKTGISIAIINLKEKGKIKRLERMLKKKFVQKMIPSGEVVCEAQLLHLLDRVKKVQVNEKMIEKFLPIILDKFAALDKEEVIKHFVSLEFNRFLDYYRNAKDINISSRDNDRDRGGDRRRDSSNGRKKRERLSKVAKLYINLGRNDQIKPKDLIGIINRATPNMSIKVGEISIKNKCSFFEVDPRDVKKLLPALNKMNANKKKIVCETSDKS